MRLKKKNKPKEKETTSLKNSPLSQLVSGMFLLCLKTLQPNQEQERKGDDLASMCQPAPASPNTGTPSAVKPGAAALHLKGQGCPAGVATCSQPLCGGTDSPVPQSCLSAIPTTDMKIPKKPADVCMQIFTTSGVSSLAEGNGASALTCWQSRGVPGAWAWMQLVRDTDGKELARDTNGKGMVRGTDGKEHSRGWGEGGRQSHTKGKAQHGRM